MAHGCSVVQAARTAVGEARHLRRLLAQVEAAFGRPVARAGSGPDVVAARLDTLRGPLGAHFDDEERAGLFEQIEERSPEQARLCARLRQEHHSLIRQLDLLRSVSPVERRGPTWGREVRHFLDELVGHESCETSLLSQAFDDSIAAAD